MPLNVSLASLPSVTLTTAQVELNRLREIEECARILHKDVLFGILKDSENLKKLGDLLNPPIDPDQLVILTE